MESAQMATYNGHKNWNHWNVSLWINNDEGLYRMAREKVKGYGKAKAAVILAGLLPPRTPDGAPYSVSAIRAALVGM
jgi:hypothetical protein